MSNNTKSNTDQQLENYKKKLLLPVEDLNESKTHAPWNEIPCEGVVIKLDDLVNQSGKSETPVVKKIQAKGDLKKYLEFSGQVLLSSIMRDETIFSFSVERYAYLINELKPDYYFTPDGETYNGYTNQSELEINRVLNETKYLLDNCQNSIAIGLIKGCTKKQIIEHIHKLIELGITLFVFHVGDFLRRGSAYEKGKVINFIKVIRKIVPFLLVYGIGSTDNFIRFNCANGFITQSHFIKAFNHKKVGNGNTTSHISGVK